MYNVTFIKIRGLRVSETFSARIVKGASLVNLEAGRTLIKMPLSPDCALVAKVAGTAPADFIAWLRKTLEMPIISKGAKVAVIDESMGLTLNIS